MKIPKIKKIFLLWIICFVTLGVHVVQSKVACSSKRIREKRFVFFISGRNNKKCYKKNLDSIFKQKYKNYYIIYFDDCSTDGTGELVAAYIKDHGLESKIMLILNEERKYKMANQYYAIYNFCEDNDIVVELDADDWLAHRYVLEYLNNMYTDPNIWLTYGQFIYYPSGQIGDSAPVTKAMIDSDNFRSLRWCYTGLYSYYAWLFKLVKKEDLIYKAKKNKFYGKFTPLATDASIIFPMLEMCRNQHFKYIAEVFYVLNRDRGEVYSREMKKVRASRAYMLRNKLPRYEAL